jgi:hypothetical protein
MRISETLDQVLRSIAAAEGSLSRETAEPGPLPAALPPRREGEGEALDTIAAEVALKRAHELGRDWTSRQLEPEEPLRVATATVERLGLGFHLGAALERVAIASREGSAGAVRLREATWLLERYARLLEERPVGADLHASAVRLARTGDGIASLQELGRAVAEENALPRRPAAHAGPPPLAGTVSEVSAPEPGASPVVHELPSLGRELLVTLGRAVIALATITALVVVLTLIADWR